MAPRILATLIGLSASAIAATSDNGQSTWGAVVFTFHGEKSPSLANSGYQLTPRGANQLVDAGAIIRDRYIQSPSNGSQLTAAAPINGISQFEIENSQFSVISTDEEYVSGSALAFMQGLYPPNVNILSSAGQLANGDYIQYPLDGYQYPNIGSLSSLDFNYIGIAGYQDCTTYSLSQIQMQSSPEYRAVVANTTEFYNSLSSTIFAEVDPYRVDYDSAFELYEYALFNYNNLANVTLEDLTRLYALASQRESGMNTPSSQGNIASIAGNTLAAKVLENFNGTVSSGGQNNKLTLLFGSYEPFLSFFALSGLTQGPSAGTFNGQLPAHGSAMVFELFSYPNNTDASSNSSPPFPPTDELFIRFLFRNGTADTEPLYSYPLFNNGPDQIDMTWSEFVAGMGAFSLNNPADWCVSCQTVNLFCPTILANYNSGNDTTSDGTEEQSHDKKLSPVIAGVVGATITIGLFIICAIVLLLLGFRLDYHEKRAKNLAGSDAGGGIGVLKRNGSGGGFKGAEKLASDTDLTLKGGFGASVVRHERVGSWELNESPVSPTDRKYSSMDMATTTPNSRVVSSAGYSRRSEEIGKRSDDGIGNVDPFGDPVKPVDHV